MAHTKSSSQQIINEFHPPPTLVCTILIAHNTDPTQETRATGPNRHHELDHTWYTSKIYLPCDLYSVDDYPVDICYCWRRCVASFPLEQRQDRSDVYRV